MFIKNKHHVISSFVADPFIPDLVRFHCPIVTVMTFSKPKISAYKRRIWIYDRADYIKYRNILNTVNWNEILLSNELDNNSKKITDIILDAASKSIPNKMATIRPNDIPWFNTNLRKLIRKRNRNT